MSVNATTNKKPSTKQNQDERNRKQDHRLQLFNDGRVGPIEKVQVSTERIVQLRAVMYDLDPANYAEGPFTQKLSSQPEWFYDRIVKSWLHNHPTLANCEVRMTGTGLHAVLWLQEPIRFETAGDRERWAGIVKVVQAALPSDPDQPGITATTRSLGSINTKNGAKVRKLTKGKPVMVEDVLQLYEELCSHPFATVLKILAGDDLVSPCPICQREDSKLSAADYTGRCYGSCGTVRLESLYDTVLAPRKDTKPRKDSRGRKTK